MVYLKAIQKITPMDVSVPENIGQKTYLKKIRGASAPLAPLDPPMTLLLCKTYLHAVYHRPIIGVREGILLRGQKNCPENNNLL